MKTVRSSKHPGLRIAPGKREPGILLTGVSGELADRFAVGERILSVDGRPIEDMLDFNYYTIFSDSPLIGIRAVSGEERRVAVPADLLAGEGLQFEPLVFKTCGNDCVFCFVKQMPTGLREDLYLMDEDYRLGFLYGNYVSMALIRDRELERIVTQRLSPVYVSVHSTDMPLRNRLLGLKRSRDIMAVLGRLRESGISIHTQIVLLPGWNDGEHLERTLNDLAALRGEPGEGGVESVGIVPVGLTAHRANLTELTPFTREGHRQVVDQVESLQGKFLEDCGSRFVFLADEFYLGAGQPLPAASAYEDLPLIDNGIGMAREFIDAVLAEIPEWRPPAQPVRVALLTGGLGAQIFRDHLLERLKPLPGLELTVCPIENRLFGARITVSGLLPGRELLAAAGEVADAVDLLVIPPNTLNAADLFLDNLSLDDFLARAPLPVSIPESGLLTGIADSVSTTG
ncbi:MAG: DUF512 domain-containing protein [bacterium]|nr:DUF512 domain-containing protein [bacterium]